MCFQGPKTCPWLKIVTKFFFLGGATELKIWDLAPTLILLEITEVDIIFNIMNHW